MNGRRRCAQVVSILCLLFIVHVAGVAETAETEGDDLVLRAIAAGYFQNRESFQSFDCRFTVREGAALSEEEAIKSGPQHDVVQADCIWIVDGDLVRYEVNRDITSDFEKMVGNYHTEPKPAGGTFYGTRLPPERVLSNKSIGVGFSPILHGGELHAEDNPPKGVVMTPLDMAEMMGSTGRWNPGFILSQYLDGGKTVPIKLASDQVGTINGQPTTLTRLDIQLGPDPAGTTVTFFLDGQRSYLVVGMAISSGTAAPGRTGKVTHVRQCSHGRWFPERMVVIDQADPETGRTHVRELQVTHLDTDKRPDKSKFAIELPEGAKLSSAANNSGFRLDKKRTVNLEDVATMLGISTRRAEAAAVRLATESDYSMRIWIIGAVGFASVLGIFLLLARRRRSRLVHLA